MEQRQSTYHWAPFLRVASVESALDLNRAQPVGLVTAWSQQKIVQNVLQVQPVLVVRHSVVHVPKENLIQRWGLPFVKTVWLVFTNLMM